MASTYVNDLRLNEMGTGDESGNWGVVTNLNLELIGEALGFGTEAITTNADTHTSTVADGATDPVRAMYVKYTGTLDSACTITIAPNTLNRMQFIENGTSGSQNIIISQGSGANVTIPAGDVKAVYLDGAGSGAAVTDAFASLSVVDLKVQDDLTVTDDLIVGGDIDLEGAIDVNGTANLDVVDIDGAVDMATTLAVAGNVDFNGDLDVDGTSNLDVVDIDGAVDMASTLQVDGAITSSAGATITTADNLDTLSLVSTDADANVAPNLRMYRNSGSPADNDQLGKIQFEGRNDNSQDVIFGEIGSQIVDASDGTEDGRIFINSIVAGTTVSRIDIRSTETIINNDSVDVDFRIESDNEDNAFFVQGNTGNIAIGHDSPDQILHLKDAGDTYIVLEAGSSDGNGGILFHNSGGTEVGTMLFDTDDDYLRILVSQNQGTAFNAASAATWRALEIFQDRDATNTGSGIAFRSQSNTAPSGIVSLAGNTTGGIEGLVFITSTGNASAERMRITDDGNIKIGDSSTDITSKLTVSGNASADVATFMHDGSAGTYFDIDCAAADGDVTLRADARSGAFPALAIKTGNAERMRIANSGLSDIFSTTSTLRLRTGTTGTSGQALSGFEGASTTANGTQRFVIYSNGNIQNTNNSYGALSDRTLKENIVDATDKLSDIKQVKVRNFNFIGDSTKQIGVVAQELETVFPALVETIKDFDADGNQLETETKSVKYSVFVPILVKAIQEQQTIIEDLKTRIETLEG